jgi:hypothetical protein
MNCSNSGTYSVEVGIGVLWHVVVEHNVNALDIHSTTEQVSGNQDTLLEILELLIAAQPATTRTHLACSHVFLY